MPMLRAPRSLRWLCLLLVIACASCESSADDYVLSTSSRGTEIDDAIWRTYKCGQFGSSKAAVVEHIAAQLSKNPVVTVEAYSSGDISYKLDGQVSNTLMLYTVDRHVDLPALLWRVILSTAFSVTLVSSIRLGRWAWRRRLNAPH